MKSDSRTSKNISELKVALVHDSLTVPGGAEKVLLELHKLFSHAPIYTPLFRPERFPEFKNAQVYTSGLNRWGFARSHHQLMIPLLPYQMEQFDLSGFDIVISDSSAVAKGVITSPDTLHICYCHTPMRWAWMSQIDRRTQTSWLRRWASHYLRIWDSSSVDRVDVWLANSRTAAARIKKFYRVSSEVIAPPAQIEKIAPSLESDDFYLTVGRLIPGNYKRTDIIIEACQKAGVNLKIAGSGPLEGHLRRLAKGDKTIEFLGFVSDHELDNLYTRCKAFLFAAEEDAGIVPIEAMAHGKPVICYGRGGAAETVADGVTGLHFSEQTADSLALAIQELKDRDFDPKKIAKHAQTFSASKFRDAMMTVIAKHFEIWTKVRYGEAKEQVCIQ